MRSGTSHIAYRSAVGIALAAAFILVWLSLGVGIIGKDGDPANLMYFGVLAVGIVGAIVARLRPQGMSRALFATALAQALVAAIALIARLGLRALLAGSLANLRLTVDKMPDGRLPGRGWRPAD